MARPTRFELVTFAFGGQRSGSPDRGKPSLSNRLKVAYWRPRRYGLRSRNDRVGVDAVVAIEIGNGAGLAEMLDAERPHPMAADRAEPGERRRMTIEHGDEAAMGRQVG